MWIHAYMLSNNVMHTSVMDCCKPLQSAAEESGRHHMHHWLLKQTQYDVQIQQILLPKDVNMRG